MRGNRPIYYTCNTYVAYIYTCIIHSEIKLTMHAKHTGCVAKVILRQWRQTCIAKSISLCLPREKVQSKSHCNTVVSAWQQKASDSGQLEEQIFITLPIGFSVVVQGWWWVIARTHALALSESSRRSDRSRDRSASVFRNSSRCIGIQPKPIIAYM